MKLELIRNTCYCTQLANAKSEYSKICGSPVLTCPGLHGYLLTDTKIREEVIPGINYPLS